MTDLEDMMFEPVQYVIPDLAKMKRDGLILDYKIDEGQITIWPIMPVPMIYLGEDFLNRCTDYTPTDHAPSLHKLSPSDIR
jgi:hypothetical protein